MRCDAALVRGLIFWVECNSGHPSSPDRSRSFELFGPRISQFGGRLRQFAWQVWPFTCHRGSLRELFGPLCSLAQAGSTFLFGFLSTVMVLLHNTREQFGSFLNYRSFCGSGQSKPRRQLGVPEAAKRQQLGIPLPGVTRVVERSAYVQATLQVVAKGPESCPNSQVEHRNLVAPTHPVP